MEEKTLIFLSTFDKKDASMEEKTDFIIGQNEMYLEYESLGEVFDYRNLPYNDPVGLKNFIQENITENQPKWIVGEGTNPGISSRNAYESTCRFSLI